MEPRDLLPPTPEKIPAIKLRELVLRFEKHFPEEMKLLRIGGVYPGEDAADVINPYTGEKDTEYFGNIGEHCMAVALCADALIRLFVEKAALDGKGIVSRALVHDANKRFEVMRRKAQGQKGTNAADAYLATAYESIKPLLATAGTPPETVNYMAEAGKETGHTSLPGFVELVAGEPVLKTDSLPRMIVHLADDMTYTPIVADSKVSSQPSYVTVQQRMVLSNFPERYPFLYTEGFGFASDDSPVVVRDITNAPSELSHVRSYADWQVWVADAICQYLLSLPGQRPDAKRDPAMQVANMVNTDIAKRHTEQSESTDTLDRVKGVADTVYDIVSAIYNLSTIRAWFDLQDDPQMAGWNYDDNIRKYQIRLYRFIQSLNKPLPTKKDPAQELKQLYKTAVYPAMTNWFIYADVAVKKMAASPFNRFNQDIPTLQSAIDQLDSMINQTPAFQTDFSIILSDQANVLATIQLLHKTLLAYERTQNIALYSFKEQKYSLGAVLYNEGNAAEPASVHMVSADISEDDRKIICRYCFTATSLNKSAIVEKLMGQSSPLYQALVKKGWIDDNGLATVPMHLEEANLYGEPSWSYTITFHLSRMADIIPFEKKL